MAVSGVIDFAIPRRDLTGSNKAIIVNRFAAPGDPATMAEGMLDLAAAEFSIYNCLNYRNLSVRVPLQELLTDHANQFGYFSNARTIADYELYNKFHSREETYPGGDSSVNAFDYQGTGSFHKVNRNGRQAIIFSGSSGYDDESYLNKVKFDNYYVQHQIPQTDVQYAWITSSLIENYTGSAFYGFEQPDFSNASRASTDIIFVSGSDSGSANIKVDFAGLNTLIIDGVLSASNLLSSSEYYNDEIESLDDILTTNAILSHRGGPAGGSNWKLYKKDSHPIVRAHREENRLSFLQTVNASDPNGASAKTVEIKSKIESPIVSKYDPVRFDVFITDPKQGGSQNVIFQQSYMNNFARFSSKIVGESEFDLNNGPFFTDVKGYQTVKLAYDTLKDLVNGAVPSDVNPISLTNTVITNEVFWPKQQFTYLSDHRQREDYVNGFWRDSSELRRAKIVSSSFNTNPYNFHVSTFLSPYSVLREFAEFPSFVGPETVIAAGTVTNPQGFTASIWPLDSRADFKTASPGRIAITGSLIDAGEGFSKRSGGEFNPIVSASQGEGILQNSMYPFSAYARVSASGVNLTEFRPWLSFVLPQYNRRVAGTIATDLDHEYKFGDTKWEAGDQSGLSPFYDTYEQYIEDIKRIGKDHSVVPEYRISEHMEHYLNNAKDFLVNPPGAYEITGTVVSSTLSDDFAKTYMHSDFLSTFNIVNSDFETLENTKITLSADALIKFLPYDGFYPADRTVQLSKLFYDSYSASFVVTGGLHAYDPNKPGGANFDSSINQGEPLPPHQSGFINPLWKSLFAPGILYNSIKSGLAVDYPVHTQAPQFTGDAAKRNDLGYLIDIPRINSDFNLRVPFEALADPVGEIGGIKIFDNEPHPSASMDLTASLGGGGRLNYILAMNNFLASTIDFFKEDGNLVTLASLADTDPKFGVGSSQERGGTNFPGFIPGREYKMRIALYNGKFSTLKSINDYLSSSLNDALVKASYNRNIPTIVNYAQTGSDPTVRSDYYGSAFGPPVDAGGTLNTVSALDPNYSSASYEPFTPPYYDGYSHIELTYRPEHEDDDIPTIISQLSQSFFRSTTSILSIGEAGGDRMQADSSLNYLQVANKPGVKYDANGRVIEVLDDTSAGNVLTIQPKWECPVLNFKDVVPTLPDIGSGSIARGMWHQYGNLPAEGEGIFLQVQDLDPSELDDVTLTGSLADKMGFRKEPVRIGEVAREKKISEAIVAIPFKEVFTGTTVKQFYKIDKRTMQAAIAQVDERPSSITSQLTPSEEILDMVRKMKKFVIPPHLDFVKNNTVTPFAMFIFDFEVTLKQQDLANIWQNLSPELGRKAIKSNASLPVRLFTPNDTFGTSMMPVFDKNTRWMVFKVKQRSAYNYFAKTADSSDDERFKFNFEFGSANAEKTSVPDYSYNWPFDFFSLIELAKVSAQHQFDRTIGIDGEPLQLPTLSLPSIPTDRPEENERAPARAPSDRGVDPANLPNFGLIQPQARVATTDRSTAPTAEPASDRRVSTPPRAPRPETTRVNVAPTIASTASPTTIDTNTLPTTNNRNNRGRGY